MPALPNPPPIVAGPAWMILAGTGYTLASVCTRELSSDYSTAQLAFMRAVVAIAFILPMIARNGISVMKTTVFPIHVVRACLTYSGMMCWFYAVSVIPISDYTALLYIQPIFTILFAMLILGEKAGPRTWGAIAVADARVVQPFDFSRLITAAIISWLAFGESSDLYTWAGALVIFCASYYVIVFERKGGH